MKLDLHVHSTYSDGAYTPQMLIDTAASIDLNVISITDHDNVLSYQVACDYIKEKGLDIEVIPGVEINTIYNNEEIHILGYFMDFENKNFKKNCSNIYILYIQCAKHCSNLFLLFSFKNI